MQAGAARMLNGCVSMPFYVQNLQAMAFRST
jgi:hypothetical protein